MQIKDKNILSALRVYCERYSDEMETGNQDRWVDAMAATLSTIFGVSDAAFDVIVKRVLNDNETKRSDWGKEILRQIKTQSSS